MIHLYIEHLLNIHTLSIQASLSTVSSKETKATLSADGTILTLTHEGESTSIKLPINLSPRKQSNVTLTIPAVPSRELSFRVQLEEEDQPNGNNILRNGPHEDGSIVPWTADSLTSETEVKCRQCSSTIISCGKVRTWKDLPSEGWAEMMEFWHCHKPHEPHNHTNGSDLNKGYAAGSKLALEAGVGMVDPLDFLVLPEDCSNFEIQKTHPSVPDQDSIIQCTSCLATLGELDPLSGGCKLRKLNLSVSLDLISPAAVFDKQKWLACLLLCAMENKGVRKFFVRLRSPLEKTLKLWIFTPDLTVSSSALSSTEPVRVVKVLWRNEDSSDVAGPERLTSAALAEDELRMSDEETSLLCSRLEQSARLFPAGARKFQDWNVGLLERFTSADTAAS